jgi:hypothetical protein
MYMLGFMLVSMIGAWAAWRHNPMYTLGRTIRFLLVFLLSIGAFIAAIQAGIHWTAGRSQAVQLAAILGITALGTLAMIGIILQLSLPAGVPLPEGTKLVRVHRAKVDMWAKRGGWTILAFAALAVVLPKTGRIIVGSLAGFFVFMMIVLLFAGYMSARKMDQWLTEVELRPWVHWTYTADQWKAWTAVRVQATNALPAKFQASWWKVSLLFGGIALGVILIDPGGWWFKLIYLTGVFGFIFLLAWWSAHSQKTLGTRVGIALAHAAAEAYFGEEGLFVDGVFLPWVSTGVYLVTAAQGSGAPAHLDFQFMKVGAGTSSALVMQSVLVPAGAAADVAKLQTALTAKCTQAAVNLA